MKYRMYFYEFSNGYSKWMTPVEAYKYSNENDVSIDQDGFDKDQKSFIRSTKDGFQSGWHPSLGMHIRGKKHFNQVLKEKGLIEMGKEKVTPQERKKKNYIDETGIKEAVDLGAEISGQEADALISGEYKEHKIIEESDRGGFSEVKTGSLPTP